MLASPCLATAATGILQNNGAAKPKITISDSYNDKLVRYYTLELDEANPGDSFEDTNENEKRDAGEPYTDDNENGKYDAPKYNKVYSYGVETTVRTSAKITLSLVNNDFTAFDFTSISAETPVAIKIGDFTFSKTLGEETGRGLYTRNGTDADGNDYSIGDPKPFTSSLVKAVYKFEQETGATDDNGDPVMKTTGTLQFDWNKTSKLQMLLTIWL